MGFHDEMPEEFRKLPDPRLDGTVNGAQTPVIAHGHWHRPGTFIGEAIEEQEPISVAVEALDGFSTVEQYREKMASLEGVQLTADGYGYGRVPSIQDRLPGTR